MLAFLLTSAFGQKIFYLPQIGDGVAGDDRFQTTMVFVSTGEGGDVTVEFFTSDGDPLALTLRTTEGDLGPDSMIPIPLGAGEAFSGQTLGVNDLVVGYARVTSTDTSVGGTAVFTQSSVGTGEIVYEAGVPATENLLEDFSFFLDSLGEKDTGLAMVNPPGGQDANLSMGLFDKLFTPIATTAMALVGGQHLPRFVREFFADFASEASEMEGVVVVESDQPLAAVTLRQNDGGRLLTAFPVVPGIAQSPAGGTFSLQSSGDVTTALDFSAAAETVIGVIYRIYQDEALIKEMTAGVSSPTGATHTLPLGESGQGVNRLEAKLIYAGGQLGQSFQLAAD